jgi:Mg2+ and Co2+ transporter CorA
VLVPDGADSLLDKFEETLNRFNKNKGIKMNEFLDEDDGDDSVYSMYRNTSMRTFPFRAVEAVLITVIMNMEREKEELQQSVYEALERLRSPASSAKLKTLELIQSVKNSIAAQDARSVMTKVALDDILNDEEDMALMCFVDGSRLDNDTQSPIKTPKNKKKKRRSKPDIAVMADWDTHDNTDMEERASVGSVDSVDSDEHHKNELDVGSNEKDELIIPPEKASQPVTQTPFIPRQSHRETIWELLQTRKYPLRMSGKEAILSYDKSSFANNVKLEDHEVFELIFETFNQTISTIQTSIDLLRSEVTNAEQFHVLRLQTARNKLLGTSVFFSIISMMVTMGSFIGSIFGMNLYSGLEDEEGVFNIVVISTSLGIVVCSGLIYGYLSWSGILSGQQ